jgi:CRISPR-associated protein Csy1
MNTDGLHTWSDIIKNYVNTLEEGDKKLSYVNELVSIFLSKKLISAKATSDAEQADFTKLQNKILKTKVTAANRPKFESYYCILRDRGQIEDFSKDIEFISNKNNFVNIWICRSVELSEGVVPGTHIAKLSHSSSAGSSILDRNDIKDNRYLTTSSLAKEIIDGTYPDARLSKQVKFLLLENKGSKLFDEILKGNYSVFSGLENSSDELDSWGGKYTAYLTRPPKTDFLLKQLYFPVENNYHLLSLLPSSSLAQKFYGNHFAKDVRKTKEKTNKARLSEIYAKDLSIRLPSVARLLVTQSQPQNVSVLNGSRGGAIRLLSSQPPTWKSQIKPPINSKSWFDRGVPFSAIKEDIEYLRSFFLRFEQLNLSTKDPKKWIWLTTWGCRILSNVLFYAESIQNLPSGWSCALDVKLKLEQQYFLDPYRTDEVFSKAKEVSDWQNVVAIDFARWLNRKIQGNEKKFTPLAEHTKLWKELMLRQLREQNQMVKAVLAAKKDEQA